MYRAPEPIAPIARRPEKPEMSQRTPAAFAASAAPAALAGADLLGSDDPSAANNPFAASAAIPEPQGSTGAGYDDIFSQTLDVGEYSDSSEDEVDWDSHDSSEDEDLAGFGSKPQPAAAAAKAQPTNDVDLLGDLQNAPSNNVESSDTSVDFDTAFTHPPAAPEPPAATDKTNPFLGLTGAGSNGNGTKPTHKAEYKKLRVRALYPYSADDGDADELVMEAGDLIETRAAPVGSESAQAHAGDGWMYGVVLRKSQTDQGEGWEPSGRKGWFPKEYVDLLGEPGSRGWTKTKAQFGTAKYEYQPQHEDELKVSVGTRVRVVDGDGAESWWKARKVGIEKDDGERVEGMLPAMYIDLDKQAGN